MLTCSICDETFDEITTHSTLCGHVFHSQCILEWLQRQQNCPVCRAAVFQDDLIKLFLVDNEVQELNTLKDQIKKLQIDKKNNENLILFLQKLSKNYQNSFSLTEQRVVRLKRKVNDDYKIICDLQMRLSLISIDLENSQDHRRRYEKQCQLIQTQKILLEKDLHVIKSQNSNVIDNLNAKIAALKSENSYLQNKCCSLEKQNKPSHSSEVKVEKDHMLLNNNTIQNTFCGHVSTLSQAWKPPDVLLQINEFYDLTESSADSSSCKRQKTNFSENEVIDLLDDESSSDDLSMSFDNTGPKKKPCILFCGFETEVEEELKLIVIELGGKLATNYHEGTHLVMNKPSKTLELLLCLSTVNHIIEENWIRISHLLNRFDDEKNYHITKIYDDPNGVNNKMICDVQRVLQNSKRQKLFEQKKFYVTPGIEFPTSDCLEKMIRSAGGTVEKEIKNMFKKCTANTCFVISCLKDLNLIEDVLEMKPFLYTSDFIMDAIMQQHISVNQNYLLVQ